jgi:hypothetical protein
MARFDLSLSRRIQARRHYTVPIRYVRFPLLLSSRHKNLIESQNCPLKSILQLFLFNVFLI